MLAAALSEVLALPRGDQATALRGLRASLPSRAEPEAWNTSFGPGSLFDAWTRSTLVLDLHQANAAILQRRLPGPGWSALEIGGGDGRLWQRALPSGARGTLWVVDPVAEVEAVVAAVLPPGVQLRFLHGRVEELLDALPTVDLAVASLTLHHVAGADAAARRAAGLTGPGKGEVLDALAAAVSENQGVVVVNEADVHCEIDLDPGDPLLEERMLDSYVRRCARALLDDIASRPDADEDLRRRWEAVVLHWCLEQLDLAWVPLARRDVYELDAARWRALFTARGLSMVSEVPTDRYGLFRQYVLR